ncbi:hypothetical protein BJX96DRAFT_65118 [Aspergillus floccosus]
MKSCICPRLLILVHHGFFSNGCCRSTHDSLREVWRGPWVQLGFVVEQPVGVVRRGRQLCRSCISFGHDRLSRGGRALF